MLDKIEKDVLKNVMCRPCDADIRNDCNYDNPRCINFVKRFGIALNYIPAMDIMALHEEWSKMVQT